MSGVGKKSLAEQILALSTLKPVSFHPDQDFLEDDTAAKLCNFSYEQEDELLTSAPPTTRAKRAHKVDLEEEEDPKYAGRVISRKELENPDDSSDEGSELELTGDEDDLLDDEDIPFNDVKMSDDEMASGSSENEDDDDNVTSGQSEAGDEKEEAEIGKGVETFPLASMKENIEKGKAARSQMKLQDGLLETRIKLQGVLSLSNRLPAPSVMPLFLKEGGAQVEEALQHTCGKLHQLLDSLLELQDKLSSRWREGGVCGGEDDGTTAPSEDEEICSDSEGEKEREKIAAAAGGKRGRKRKRSGSRKDYEEEICKRHEELRPHRNAVLSKWDEKTRLASGNITSKAFMEVDRSILSQIEHVLKDEERLRKRTQLKRSVYRILGEPEETEEVTKPEDGSLDKQGDDQERDQHLKDYNEHIFDDDDFYHQLLRELIERKTSSSESSDPVEMGRQWLELQKLRSKAKKKVDTKASKGRKLRYNVHPKLVDFMAPVERGTFSDSARNSLFSSLFGAHHYRQQQQE